MPAPRSPYRSVTFALAVAIVLVFVVEVMAAKGEVMGFSPPLLVRLGGNVRRLTLDDHQYWRLLTAAYLHGGLIHVVMNLWALWTIGTALETVLNGGWMLFAFGLSGLTGSLVSAWGHRGNVVAIGASGGIFGLIAMAAVLAFALPREIGLRRQALVQWLIFGLVLGVAGGFDNWGHVGGIAGGVLAAVLVIALHRHRGALLAVGWAGGALVAAASLAAGAMASQSQSMIF